MTISDAKKSEKLSVSPILDGPIQACSEFPSFITFPSQSLRRNLEFVHLIQTPTKRRKILKKPTLIFNLVSFIEKVIGSSIVSIYNRPLQSSYFLNLLGYVHFLTSLHRLMQVIFNNIIFTFIRSKIYFNNKNITDWKRDQMRYFIFFNMLFLSTKEIIIFPNFFPLITEKSSL